MLACPADLRPTHPLSPMSLSRIQSLVVLLAAVTGAAGADRLADALPERSEVIEVAGSVEFQIRGGTDWVTATNGLPLSPGDKLRTRTQSRAAVRFSDRSVLRLSESTTLEVQPPRHAERRRFRLPFGSLFFFNREKPSRVEFE